MALRFNNSQDFINALALLIDKTRYEKGERKQTDYTLNNMDTTFKMGTVDPAYSGSGRPKIIFEGETVASGKSYPYLAPYAPAAGDVVLMARVGNSYIILGKRV